MIHVNGTAINMFYITLAFTSLCCFAINNFEIGDPISQTGVCVSLLIVALTMIHGKINEVLQELQYISANAD